MIRRSVFRVCLLAILLAPALVFWGAGAAAQAQQGGWRIEKSWKCRTCGGYLGNGVAPPTSCHHCANKRANAAAANANKPKDPMSTATIVIAGVVVFAVVGLGVYFLSSRGGSGAAG